MAELAARRLAKALRGTLDQRDRERAPLRLQRVVGRAVDGTIQLQRLDAQCVTRGAATNHYGGQIIAEPAGSHFSRRGTSGVALLQESAVSEVLWVERLIPDRFLPGNEYFVTVIGRGFTESTAFEFLEPGGKRINEDIQVLSKLYVSPQTVELVISVSAQARLYRDGAPLAYGEER